MFQTIQPVTFCDQLILHFSEQNQSLLLKDGVLYSDSGRRLICYMPSSQKKRCEIPDGVISIGDNAFQEVDHPLSVVIPDSVTDIGSYAFPYKMNNYVLCGSHGSTAEKHALEQGCRFECLNNAQYSRLQEFDEDDSTHKDDSLPTYEYILNEAGDAVITAYHGNSATLDIPAELDGHRVTEIGDEAFWYNPTLEKVTIPNTVTRIGTDVFSSCANLESISIPDSVTTIGSSFVCDCPSLRELIIPESVLELDTKYMCTGCTSLTTVVLPSSVTMIGDNAFNHCLSLTGLELPENVTCIWDYAFRQCRSLEKVFISAKITEMIGNPFCGCERLQINVDPGNTVFEMIDGFLVNSVNHTLINAPLVQNKAACTIPQGILSIGDEAFSYWNLLECIDIPDSVQSIEGSAFFGCESLRSVRLSDHLNKIGWQAFGGCSALDEITIPNSVLEIEDDAFAYCAGELTIVCEPESYAAEYAKKQKILFRLDDTIPTWVAE